MSTLSAKRRATLIGWLAILTCSLILYDALLVSSLHKELWNSATASARVAVGSLKNKVALGVRFGKKLEKYQGLEIIVKKLGRATGIPLAVLGADGKLLHSHGDVLVTAIPINPSEKRHAMKGGDNIRLHEDREGASVLAPVLRRDGGVAGYIAARVIRAPLEEETARLFLRQVKGQGLIALGGLLLLGGLFHIRRKDDEENPRREERFIRIACFCVFLLVMLGNGALALHAISARSAQGLDADAERTGALLTDDLNRLLLVGVSLDRADRADAYLAGIAAAHGGDLVLDIINSEGTRFAGSAPPDVELLPGGHSFALLDRASSLHQAADSGWTLRVSIARSPWMERMIAAALDILTLVIIALIFMVELFLLISRGTEARSSGLTHARCSDLFRPLMFAFILAMDMSVSFIPLRMAELTPSGVFSRDLVLGLPISAEMGMTGISVLIAGAWMKRHGPRPPLLTGIACMTIGYLGSMLAATPWQFIAARAVVGLGYGLSLLAAQAHTVKDGKLADMFAGVYAGSLCGSALGAMLAERLGYPPVFALSACVLACLVPLAWLLLKRDTNNRGARRPQEDSTAETTASVFASCFAPGIAAGFARFRRLLADRRLVAFSLLGVLPSAMLCVGFLNYFLPVYLKGADVAQSNIGRVYMLNCLIVIYSGPPLSALVMKSTRKARMVFWAGLLSALSLLGFILLPPLPASVLGSVLIGLATGLNIPAYSEYLLQLDLAHAIGVDQAMSLLDALQRIGQVLGPICVGGALAVMSVDSAALWAGGGLAAISLLFLVLVAPVEKTRETRENKA